MGLDKGTLRDEINYVLKKPFCKQKENVFHVTVDQH